MNQYCNYYSQNCSYGCCDSMGMCPFYRSDCYYYYNSGIELSSGAKAGVAVGVVLFFVGLGILIYFCCRKRQMPIQQTSFQEPSNTTIVVPGGAGYGGAGYGMAQPAPYGQPYGQPYAQPYGQTGGGPVIINHV